VKVDPKFTRPGKGQGAKPLILYAGLLDTATENGLRSITTQLLHLDLERKVAVVKATVTMERDGVVMLFEGIGDATPENAGQVAAVHWIRMAETRGKARALKDAINVGDCSIEGDEWDDAPDYPASTSVQHYPVAQSVRPPPPPPRENPRPPATAPATEAPAEPTPIRPDVAPAPPPDVDPEVEQLQRRYAEVVFDAESRGLRPPTGAPTNAAGLTRAIASLEGQIQRARAIDQPPRRSGGRR
jgi:hypothetical protein